MVGGNRWALRKWPVNLGSPHDPANPPQNPAESMDAVYLDHAATSPVREEVREAMAPFSGPRFGNPSSTHRWGRAARVALDESRDRIAGAIGARADEIYFVRGGTESDNLAVVGGHTALCDNGPAGVAVSAVEHSAVLEPAAWIGDANRGRFETLAVTPTGEIDTEALEVTCARESTLVSVMFVNNETGMILPLDEVATIGRRHGAVLHTDACQALGKVPVDLRSLDFDLLTGTGHKISGPKGAAFLFVRRGVAVSPLLFGGSQERALRPGTEDVAGAVGLATAVALATAERERLHLHLTGLRDRLETGLRNQIEGVRVNGHGAPRSPHVTSIGIPDVDDGAALLMALDLEGLAVSGGSACHSGSARASHVVSALYGADDPYATIRFSFGASTTDAEIDRALDVVSQVVGRMTQRVPA